MPVPELLIAAHAAACSHSQYGLGSLLGYGPLPGVELIPYFLALLLWVGLALLSILLSPISALIRFIRKARRSAPIELNSEMNIAPADSKGEPVDLPSAKSDCAGAPNGP